MEDNILIFVIFGFLAQMIDGALGMAYGVSSTTFLLSLGIPPAAASASVHIAEVCTTAVSGLSHMKFGNVDKLLFKRLVIAGVLGGITGAYILSEVPGDIIKPFVSGYLVIMGLVILWKAFTIQKPHVDVTSHLFPLGLVGGFFDAIGGGGWGPIVTTTLLARGSHPRFTVGSVNATEFFVTFAESVMFLLTIGLTHWHIIVGLLIGGVIAAPLAAYTVKRLPTRALMILVGILITALSIRTIILSF